MAPVPCSQNDYNWASLFQFSPIISVLLGTELAAILTNVNKMSPCSLVTVSREIGEQLWCSVMCAVSGTSTVLQGPRGGVSSAEGEGEGRAGKVAISFRDKR